MSETVAATPDEPDKSESQGGYLPKLPEGWQYDVRLVAPSGITQQISVHPNPFQAGGWVTEVKSHSKPGGLRSLTSEGLTAAARAAANAAKSLAKIRVKEQELEAERANLLGALPAEDAGDALATVDGTVTVSGDGTIHADEIRVGVMATDDTGKR